jgi:hypothetical protein
MLRMDHMSGDYLHALSVFLVFLTFLGRINAEHGYPVSYEAFYIPNLHHICDLKLAYLNWRIAKQQASWASEVFFRHRILTYLIKRITFCSSSE